MNSGPREGLSRRLRTADRRRAKNLSNRSSADFHVAGVVVHATPSAVGGVARDIAAISGARVHASSAAGKLVVTLEGSATDAVVAGLECIRRLHGVIAASLVYQHGDEGDGDEPRQSAGDAE